MKAIFAFLSAGLLAQPFAASAQEIMSVNNMDQSCRNHYPGPSPAGKDIMKVTFLNTRNALVWPAWINQGGFVAVYPEEIPPGGRYTTYTRVGHRWMMIDGSNWECVQHFTIEADTARYRIE
ncbi:MAG: hypothetical protein CSA74_07605 [Rhodobacterales bacterium]|nr:MAG: hypothetical protein CSA74_07605 [Rhodobacterales bacterium]